MIDLATDLRKWADTFNDVSCAPQLRKAADEIERLRTALQPFMKIVVRIAYNEPEVRQLDVIVDGKPWYQEFLLVQVGLSRYLVIGEHSLSIEIGPEPIRKSSHE